MRTYLKTLAGRLARTRAVRAFASHLIYPTIVEDLCLEIQADICSPSGVAEAFAWKTHSYIVLAEELRPTGRDCAADGMRHDAETRTRIIDIVFGRTQGIVVDVLEFGVAALANRCVRSQNVALRGAYMDSIPLRAYRRIGGPGRKALSSLKCHRLRRAMCS
jgi:hypothetical protein